MKRILAPLLALLLLGSAAGAVYRYWQRGAEKAVSAVEREPNNEPAQANRIALGVPIQGMIGTPLSDRESDRDIFVLDLDEPAAVSVEVTGVADMNLVVEVLQVDSGASGEQKLVPRLFLDDAPAGQGERVDGLPARAGLLYVRIQERAYFTEPSRPPRQTTHASYALTVSKTPADGQMEVEPNDTLLTATRVGIGKAVVGFTGAAVPYNATFAEHAFSGVDFLVAYSEESAPRNMAAVLVGPPSGSISAVDAGAFEAWQRKFKAGPERSPPLPEPLAVSHVPKLLTLSPSSVGFGVRIQAADFSAQPGSPYSLAFVTDGPEGMSGALDLANSLLRANRPREAQEVLQLAEARFPQSPQLAKLRALKIESEKVATGSP